MMPFPKIKNFYFTACAIIFALLFVLMLIRSNWTITPQGLFSTIVGWLVICAVLIAVIYMLVGKRVKYDSEQAAQAEDDTDTDDATNHTSSPQ